MLKNDEVLWKYCSSSSLPNGHTFSRALIASRSLPTAVQSGWGDQAICDERSTLQPAAAAIEFHVAAARMQETQTAGGRPE
jgi:hypothetical protein